MGVADGLAGDRAQAEPLRRVETGAADIPVVQRNALRLAIFQIEFTIVGPVQRVGDQRLRFFAVQSGAREE
jgi:hypothetical protein